MSVRPDEPPTGRTAQKRQAIRAEATTLFLRHGFRGTSMDEIASAAGVSKQTVYKQFTGKERLFRDIVEGVARNSDTVVLRITGSFGDPPAGTREELESRLAAVARAYLDGVLQEHVLSLRRLIIAEAEQFPDLAVSYYEQAPSRGIEVTAQCLEPYVASGLLAADDLRLAAAQFAYLALSPAQDRAMFVPSKLPSSRERDRLAAAAARMFLAAYGR
ncbi:TetR/AcrR family transcriptional regulator [Amycolatopsis jiangsuensis]|uniref:TetR/AcrR family transcriptional repressor of mexJK operon n=1 Tax=Amycolatopsis jiangsuensis TaxID=1181879 RepID=A0A840IQZ7_9PSEU|nr:TetR/AcrR family transcriptional regulator [Amycolatopsis jiangsuensis]MBB4684816.1 TetR/AcrR family transcriptional repressor of mexJK operon [Amycolatopsis jiangsuensis]